MKKQIISILTLLLSFNFIIIHSMESVEFSELMKGNLAEDILKKAHISNKKLKKLKIDSPISRNIASKEITLKKIGPKTIAIQLSSVKQPGVIRCGYFTFVNSQILGSNDAKIVTKINDSNSINRYVNNLYYLMRGWDLKAPNPMLPSYLQESQKGLNPPDIAFLNNLFTTWVGNYADNFFDLLSKPSRTLFKNEWILEKRYKDLKPMDVNERAWRDLIDQNKKIKRTILTASKIGEIKKSALDEWAFSLEQSFDDFTNPNAKEIYMAGIGSHWIAVRAEKIKVGNEIWLALIIIDSYYNTGGASLRVHSGFLKNLSKKLGYEIEKKEFPQIEEFPIVN